MKFIEFNYSFDFVCFRIVKTDSRRTSSKKSVTSSRTELFIRFRAVMSRRHLIEIGLAGYASSLHKNPLRVMSELVSSKNEIFNCSVNRMFR